MKRDVSLLVDLFSWFVLFPVKRKSLFLEGDAISCNIRLDEVSIFESETQELHKSSGNQE